MEYDWPGNIRELENAVTNMCIKTHGEVLSSMVIPNYIRTNRLSRRKGSSDLKDFLSGYLDNTDIESPVLPRLVSMVEKSVIDIYMDKLGDNKTKIAEALGISRVTLLKKLKE